MNKEPLTCSGYLPYPWGLCWGWGVDIESGEGSIRVGGGSIIHELAHKNL